MKQLLLLTSLFLCIGFAQAQEETLESLKAMQAEKQGIIADLSAQVGAAQGEVDALQKKINVLTGWRKGINGVIGFDWNKSNGWISSPNPESESTSLNIGLTAYANNDKEKYFWNNKGMINKSWQNVKLSDADTEEEDDGLFDNGIVDILNISSLAGYKVTDKLAFSGLGELNTSVENFLSPGSLDIGVGATWLPIQNMTVVVHPLNYHIAFPADGAPAETSSQLGAKVRVDYFRDFNVSGKNVNWSTTLTSFIPYGSLDPIDDGMGGMLTPKLNNYTWLNTLSFEVWKGIGVGIGWGIRKADFESDKTQSYTNIGLSYGF